LCLIWPVAIDVIGSLLELLIFQSLTVTSDSSPQETIRLGYFLLSLIVLTGILWMFAIVLFKFENFNWLLLKDNSWTRIEQWSKIAIATTILEYLIKTTIWYYEKLFESVILEGPNVTDNMFYPDYILSYC